jgi:hypothetical protein
MKTRRGVVLLKTLRVVVLISPLVFSFARQARGECVNLSIAELKAGADVVFSGTVTSVSSTSPMIVSFYADAVWKGPVHKKIALFQLSFAEAIPFRVNQWWVIFASRPDPAWLDERLRRGSAARPDAEWEIDSCAVSPEGPRSSDWIRELGPSHPPSEPR